MDIKSRIDNLTEAEAKAALYLAIKALGGAEMNTVRGAYEKLDAKRRELDMLIFSVVGLDAKCGDMDAMDTETRQAIIKKADEIACAEKNFVLDILGRA